MKRNKFLACCVISLSAVFAGVVLLAKPPQNETTFNYADDVYLMEELSGAGVIAGLNHKERTLVIFDSPLEFKKICVILLRHQEVKIKRIYDVLNKKILDCKADLKNSI